MCTVKRSACNLITGTDAVCINSTEVSIPKQDYSSSLNNWYKVFMTMIYYCTEWNNKPVTARSTSDVSTAREDACEPYCLTVDCLKRPKISWEIRLTVKSRWVRAELTLASIWETCA